MIFYLKLNLTDKYESGLSKKAMLKFALFIHLNNSVFEVNLLLSYPLTKRYTGEDIFNVTKVYFKQHDPLHYQ